MLIPLKECKKNNLVPPLLPCQRTKKKKEAKTNKIAKRPVKKLNDITCTLVLAMLISHRLKTQYSISECSKSHTNFVQPLTIQGRKETTSLLTKVTAGRNRRHLFNTSLFLVMAFCCFYSCLFRICNTTNTKNSRLS